MIKLMAELKLPEELPKLPKAVPTDDSAYVDHVNHGRTTQITMPHADHVQCKPMQAHDQTDNQCSMWVGLKAHLFHTA